MNSNEEKYLDIYCFERINDFPKIAARENIPEFEVRQTYKSIDHYIGAKIGLSEIETKKLHKKLEPEINKINKVFSSRFYNQPKRKKGFGDFRNFYNWHQKQPKKCFYCETDEQLTLELFKKGFFKSKKPSWKGRLEIERKDGEEYTPENCVLACLFCNNAKADLIKSDDFKEYIAKGFGNYLKTVSKKELGQ